MGNHRRKFLKSALWGSVAQSLVPTKAVVAKSYIQMSAHAHLKLSCNLYSFNDPLRKGEMTLEEVFQFCSDVGFAAVDPTGYYFPGYPAVPADEYRI